MKNQPRVPAGSPQGGEFAKKGSGVGISAARLARFDRDINNAIDRIDKEQSDYARKTGYALSRTLAAYHVANKR